MSLKRLFGVTFIVLLVTCLFLSVVTAQVQEVLKLDESTSYVLNLETGSKQRYTEFLASKQSVGNRLEFNIYVSATGILVSEDYVLELRTNLDNPEWKFGDEIYHSANVLVWKGSEAHGQLVPKIILSGDVPKPIKTNIKEPGFGEYDIWGIGEKVVYVELTVGTTSDGATLGTIIQKLEPSITFYSTNDGIQNAKSTVEENLEEASGKIGETDLDEDIRQLYEEGHPGWAARLSEHYKELSVAAEPPPLTLYVILSVMLGLILGAAFVSIYVSRGAGKGVDVSQISADLNDTTTTIEEKSSSITAISTKFARSEDDEKRDAARELIRIRASLNEISNELRSIADRIKSSR
jgi:hypothetical protein